MTNQSLMQKYQPRGEIGPRIPDTADADRKAVEAPLLIDNLWRQIDRWVNEGRCGRRWHHAISVPEMITKPSQN
jgi:hypothetical protein